MRNEGPYTGHAMQRVKVGATGLAAVLLLIALASAVLSWASKGPSVAVNGAGKPAVTPSATLTNVTAIADQPAKEPLAELGVAPSAAPDNSTTPPAKH